MVKQGDKSLQEDNDCVGIDQTVYLKEDGGEHPARIPVVTQGAKMLLVMGIWLLMTYSIPVYQ